MPLIPDLPSSDSESRDTTSQPSKATQKLTARPAAPTRTTQTWWTRLAQPMMLPHATQLGLSAAGGAVGAVLVSLAIGSLVSSGEPIRDFFGRSGQENSLNSDHTLQEMPDQTVLAPAQAEIEVQPASSTLLLRHAEPVMVEGANEEGTALAALEPVNDDDRRRIEKRREDDRMLREKRELEDRKRAIERQLEDKQLEERRRGEDSRLIDGRRDEDRKRIEGWLEEDRRLLEERERKEKEAIAEAQHEDNQQLAEAQR